MFCSDTGVRSVSATTELMRITSVIQSIVREHDATFDEPATQKREPVSSRFSALFSGMPQSIEPRSFRPYSERTLNFTASAPEPPRFVLIVMTPFAARVP